MHVYGQDVTLRPGDTATAPIGSLHHFANRTDRPVTATVELRPGSLGFERAIQIAYGLAEDGLANEKGVPRNLMHLGLLAEMADSQLTGVLRVIEPALRALARRARRKGVDRELIALLLRRGDSGHLAELAARDLVDEAADARPCGG